MSEAPSNPALEEAIYESPDAPDTYLVYSDWLQGKGDPLGELIAVQAALASAPTPALADRAKTLLAEHERDWLGEVLVALANDDQLTVEWRYGFLAKVAMGGDEHGNHHGAEAVAALLERRVARYLRDLEINVFDSGDGNPSFDGIIDAMVATALPRTLRSLAFDIRRYQISWTSLGDLSPLYPQLASLEELRLKVGETTLGAIDLPRLRRFSLVTGGLADQELAAIASARWPELESLVVYLGTEEYGGTSSVATLAPLLAGKDIPKLEHLALCNAQHQDDVTLAVVGSALLRRLKTLDLSQGTMTDHGAQALLDHASRLGHLERLIVRRNYIGPEMVARLGAAFGDRLDASDQGRENVEEDRYVQISE